MAMHTYLGSTVYTVINFTLLLPHPTHLDGGRCQCSDLDSIQGLRLLQQLPVSLAQDGLELAQLLVSQIINRSTGVPILAPNSDSCFLLMYTLGGNRRDGSSRWVMPPVEDLTELLVPGTSPSPVQP